MVLVPAANSTGCMPICGHCSTHLTSTLMGDNCIMGATKAAQNKCNMQSLAKCFSTSSFSVRCHHKIEKSKDIQVDGMLINNKCFTHPSVITDLDKHHPHANADNSMETAWEESAVPALNTQKQAQAVSDQCAHATTANFDQKCRQMPVTF